MKIFFTIVFILIIFSSFIFLIGNTGYRICDIHWKQELINRGLMEYNTKTGKLEYTEQWNSLSVNP